MRMDDIIAELQDIIQDAKNMPLSNNKAVIDRDLVLGLLDDLADSAPAELMQAKAIAADRQKILDDATEQGNSIIKVAEERRRAMIDQQEIVKLANKKAKEILEDAQRQSKELKKATHSYVDEVMRKTEETIAAQLGELKKVRQSVKNAASKNS